MIGNFYLDRGVLGGQHKCAIQGLILICIINMGQWIYATVYDKGNQPEPLINARVMVKTLLFLSYSLCIAGLLIRLFRHMRLFAAIADYKPLTSFIIVCIPSLLYYLIGRYQKNGDTETVI